MHWDSCFHLVTPAALETDQECTVLTSNKGAAKVYEEHSTGGPVYHKHFPKKFLWARNGWLTTAASLHRLQEQNHRGVCLGFLLRSCKISYLLWRAFNQQKLTQDLWFSFRSPTLLCCSWLYLLVIWANLIYSDRDTQTNLHWTHIKWRDKQKH